jgi:Spy/CpxP family protein refolding chaperone
MSTDTMKPQRTVLRDDRKTVTQLLAAAEKDTAKVTGASPALMAKRPVD